MIREQVIVHTEKIDRIGQSIYFQVVLPKDTARIIGVETGAFWINTGSGGSGPNELLLTGGDTGMDARLMKEDPQIIYDELFTITQAATIGRLTLHNPESTDIFYQGEIRQQDISLPYADFTQYPLVFNEWSHGRKRYETVVSVESCSPLIEGHYTDSWGVFTNEHIIYQLNIYIWIEKKTS